MPAFHRPPEWQQSADRHTQLIDPVLTVRQLSRFELSLKSTVRIDHALVFSTAKGGYEAYLPPRRPTRSEIAARHYTAVYEVDMGVHPFSGTLTLPSDNDAFEFSAEVDVSWQVVDPERFVGSGHRDVPGLLIGELQRAARPVSRRFPIAESAAAEGELLQAINVLGPLGAPAGLQTTWTLRLRRDQENIDHQRRLQAIDHSATEQVRAAERGSEVDVEVDRRNRQQDALQIERAMSYGTQQQHLALQQQRWDYEQAALQSSQQHQLAIQQGHQELEMQRIEAEKIAFYQWHLSQGGVQAWALHLAQHPEDSRLVMTSMRDDQLRMIQAQMDLVKDLLHGDNAEKFELEGPKQLALRTVSDILTQRLPGVPQTPPSLPGGEGDPYGDPYGAGYGQGVPGVPGQPGFVPGAAGQAGLVAGQPGSAPGPHGPVPGQPGFFPGQSGPVPGQPASGPGQSSPVPGQPVSVPGAPGQPGFLPGQSGPGPGQQASVPGQSAVAPGQPGVPPGQSGPVPGQPGFVSGPPGSVPGQPDLVSGPPGPVPGQPGSMYGTPGRPPSDATPAQAQAAQPPVPPGAAPAASAWGAQSPASPYPGAPQAPAGQAPMPGAGGPYGAVPSYGGPGPADVPGPPTAAPYVPPGAPYQQPYAAPQAPAWQPPPGYGSTPTLPEQQNASADEAGDGSEEDKAGGGA
uniref:PE-PGRS family protein n=1 Tax=Streptomyces sp. NBC_00093 TaxID=2975649 RepID=A0AAU2A049_9ACTN